MVVLKLCGLTIFCLLVTGCANKNSDVSSEGSSQIKLNSKKSNISDEERRIHYKGDYDIAYKQPRVVWFKPLLTEKGNIVSERTITLAPKDLRWQKQESANTGENFKKLTGEVR